MNDLKTYHHHTPRFYLLPWADADERIWWQGWGKIRQSGLTVVGGENNFYRITELSDSDREKLAALIKKLAYANELNERFWSARRFLYQSE